MFHQLYTQSRDMIWISQSDSWSHDNFIG